MKFILIDIETITSLILNTFYCYLQIEIIKNKKLVTNFNNKNFHKKLKMQQVLAKGSCCLDKWEMGLHRC